MASSYGEFIKAVTRILQTRPFVRGKLYNDYRLCFDEIFKPVYPRCFADAFLWIHGNLKTFMTSSPRWLITFTAIRPLFGLSNGREVSLCSVAQASGSISALSVVLRAL